MEQSKFYQIKNVTEHEYTLVDCDGSVITRPIQDVDKSASAFTIKDAKDGDILASKSGNKIFSYRGYLDLRGNPCAYYGIYKVHDGICFSPCAIGNSFTWEEVFPATKEQRKILFEERTAAGGVLHFSKKELKNIKDETEIPFGAKDSELQDATYYIPKGFHAEIDDDKVVIKKGEKPTWSEKHIADVFEKVGLAKIVREQSNDNLTIALQDAMIELSKVTLQPNPTAWSKEDENLLELSFENLTELKDRFGKDYGRVGDCINWLKSLKGRVQPQPKQKCSEWDRSKIQRICKYLDEAKKYYTDITEVRECIDWLKFLRPQYIWQPSDEQMKQLGKYCPDNTALTALYEQLKKLKGE